MSKKLNILVDKYTDSISSSWPTCSALSAHFMALTIKNQTPRPRGSGNRECRGSQVQQDPQALPRPAGACSERAAACCLRESAGWLGTGFAQILPASPAPEKSINRS